MMIIFGASHSIGPFGGMARLLFGLIYVFWRLIESIEWPAAGG